MDLGPPVSYMALEEGTAVYSSDEEKIGVVVHVLAAEDEDVFDGLVIGEHRGPGGHRFADADQVERIYRDGVVLKLSHEESDRLPEPSANPAVMRDDPADPASGRLAEKLRRAWDYLSGNY
jgi:hypothetical protein